MPWYGLRGWTAGNPAGRVPDQTAIDKQHRVFGINECKGEVKQ